MWFTAVKRPVSRQCGHQGLGFRVLFDSGQEGWELAVRAYPSIVGLFCLYSRSLLPL